MRFFLLLLVSLATAGTVAAQSGRYEPGYLVVEGDTVRGEVLIGDDRQATRGARFRTAPDARPSAVGLADAEAFGTAGGRDYRRGLYPSEPTGPDVQSRRGFARVVRDGTADLLRYEPTELSQIFYLDLDGERTGLLVVERTVETLGRPRVFLNELYKQAVRDRLVGCGVTDEDVAALDYTEAAFASVVDAYNACRDPAYRPPVGAPRRPLRRGSLFAVEVSLGAQTSAFRRISALSPADDPPQPAATLGVLTEVQFSRLPSSLGVVLRLDAERTLIRHTASDSGPVRDEVRRDALLFGLGTRLTVRVAGAPAFVGVGYQSGVTSARTGQPDVPAETVSEEGIVGDVGRRPFASLGGFYGEVGVRPTARLGIVARARTAKFSADQIYLPGDDALEERSFGLGTASVALTTRF